MTEWTKEQNEIINQKFEGLMDSVFTLIDYMYERERLEGNIFTEAEEKFYDAFHEYIWALSDDDDLDKEE